MGVLFRIRILFSESHLVNRTTINGKHHIILWILYESRRVIEIRLRKILEVRSGKF